MSWQTVNIVLLLRDREYYRPPAVPKRDCSNGSRGAAADRFKLHANQLAEHALLEKLKDADLCRPLNDLANETESVFNIEQSHNGLLAATVQTNKSVNVFEVTTLRKVAEYRTNERSVWTLAFHPSNMNIVAFGTLGGKVCVYVDGKEVAAFKKTEPIGTICFHPVHSYLVLTSSNVITFWNWQNETASMSEMNCNCKCRFLHVTSDSRLITGISLTSVNDLNSAAEPSPQVVPLFFRTVCLLLESLENSSCSLRTELDRQFIYWNWVLDKLGRNAKTVKCVRLPNRSTAKENVVCKQSDLNLTLRTLIRRLDALQELAIMLLDPIHESNTTVHQYCKQPLRYFERIWSKYVPLQSNKFIKYNFDMALIHELLSKMFLLFGSCSKPISEMWRTDRGSLFQQQVQQQDQHQQESARETPCFALQAWDIGWSDRELIELPDFKEDWKNVITTCQINNDSNVAISQCEQFIASVRLRTVNELEIRSLRRENFGDTIFVFKFLANFVSLSFSPSGRYVAVGLRCRRNLNYAYIVDKDASWCIGVEFPRAGRRSGNADRTMDGVWVNERVGLKLCLPLDPNMYNEINCIKWATLPGYGLFVGLKSKFLQVCRVQE